MFRSPLKRRFSTLQSGSKSQALDATSLYKQRGIGESPVRKKDIGYNGHRISGELGKPRFVDIKTREKCDQLNEDQWRAIWAAQRKQTWKSETIVLKSPFDLIMYPQLIKDEQIKTVIELGTFHGGGICMLNNIASSAFGCVAEKWIGVDINFDNLTDEAKQNKNIEWCDGDMYQMELFFDKYNNGLLELPKPWFIIEDAHFGCDRFLEVVHKYLTPGDYVVIEDTNGTHNQIVRKFHPNVDTVEIDQNDKNLIITEEFLNKYEDFY
eukprot:UN30032